MACQVALVMPLESWSAPRNHGVEELLLLGFDVDKPETAATMMTITVIESISFRARRRGIKGIQT